MHIYIYIYIYIYISIHFRLFLHVLEHFDCSSTCKSGQLSNGVLVNVLDGLRGRAHGEAERANSRMDNSRMISTVLERRQGLTKMFLRALKYSRVV